MAANDYLCLTPDPITDIYWWGSYLGWSGVEPPQPPLLVPDSFHIGIWTDVPAGVFSHPGTMIWEWIVPRSALHERPVACDWHPEHMPPEFGEACFKYDFQIPPEQWFYQGPQSAIFWISISAMYPLLPCACHGDVNGDGFVNFADMTLLISCMGQPPLPPCDRADINCDGQIGQPDADALTCLMQGWPPDMCCPPFSPAHAWGWKTRRPSWGDDAVRIYEPTAPHLLPPFPVFVSGSPIANIEGSWDMSFVLTAHAQTCLTDADCVLVDADVCTCDRCVDGFCEHTPIEFGNVDCSAFSQPNLDDILCVLSGFAGFTNCPNGDIHPYCTGNNVINLDDILAVLAAFAGFDPCSCQP